MSFDNVNQAAQRLQASSTESSVSRNPGLNIVNNTFNQFNINNSFNVGGSDMYSVSSQGFGGGRGYDADPALSRVDNYLAAIQEENFRFFNHLNNPKGHQIGQGLPFPAQQGGDDGVFLTREQYETLRRTGDGSHTEEAEHANGEHKAKEAPKADKYASRHEVKSEVQAALTQLKEASEKTGYWDDGFGSEDMAKMKNVAEILKNENIKSWSGLPKDSQELLTRYGFTESKFNEIKADPKRAKLWGSTFDKLSDKYATYNESNDAGGLNEMLAGALIGGGVSYFGGPLGVTGGAIVGGLTGLTLGSIDWDMQAEDFDALANGNSDNGEANQRNLLDHVMDEVM